MMATGRNSTASNSSLLVDRLLGALIANANGHPFALGFNTGIEYALKQIAASDDIAAIMAGMASTPDAPPVAPAEPEPPRYRTPQATIDAFKYVVSLADVKLVKDWLAARPKDAPFLVGLLESKTPC